MRRSWKSDSDSDRGGRQRGPLAAARLEPAVPAPLAVLVLVLAAAAARAYIPAQPVNDTSALNLTDSSTISIVWTDPEGVFSGGVSYQLRADVATGGTTAGALVHFAESNMGANVSTATPWIAYISCDYNESVASDEWDIFTLARDRGAVSALLYTTTAESCLIDATYIEYFEKPLDVFATQTKQVARVIDTQFDNTNSTFYNYSSAELNQSALAVNKSLTGSALSYKTFLVGTLVARNSTGQAESGYSTASAGAGSSAGAGHTAKRPTNLAAIIVPSILGALVALTFGSMCCRARRRRGRGRAGAGADRPGRPLTKSVVDSFPLVTYAKPAATPPALALRPAAAPEPPPSTHRFASTASTAPLLALQRHSTADSAAASDSQHSWPSRDRRDSLGASDSTLAGAGAEEASIGLRGVGRRDRETGAKLGTEGDGGDDGEGDVDADADAGAATAAVWQMPEHYGDAECSICLVGYEDGDRVRQLLCAGRHRFHADCVDAWLMNNDGSCPLCRQDLRPGAGPAVTQAATSSALARYIATRRARRRDRRDRRDGAREDTSVGVRGGASRDGDEDADSGDVHAGPREADQGGAGGY
ncbi:hypothetical protein Q5752_001014 [Cryptotrichosporon argae]